MTYTVIIAYKDKRKIKKEIFQKDFINEALSASKLFVNTQVLKSAVLSIMIVWEDN